MENTEDNIDTQIALLPPLLEMFTMFKMLLWYDKENHKEKVVDNIAIRCINFEKKLVYM